MTETGLQLCLYPSGYWLHAHGEGGGADFDLVMERDDDGLPMLRGKHVAGLVRLALERAAEWGWLENKGDPVDVPVVLMGGEGEPGCLAISSARVDACLRANVLRDTNIRDVRPSCFRRIASTAVESLRLTAKEKHLRAIEAAVPLPLTFSMSFVDDQRLAWAAGLSPSRSSAATAEIAMARASWRDWLGTAWPALDEVGAKRTRGFGRLSWTEYPGGQEREAQR